MTNTSKWVLRNLHLIISTIIVCPTGIIYGSPSTLPHFLDIKVDTIDLSNLLKALMVFYIGISIVWILGIFKKEYWIFATKLNLLFMSCLGIGRILSIIVDGLPSFGFIFGTVGEIVLAIFSFYQLKRYHT